MAADITMDGMTFISSKRASELSGYTQDYIGQLARTGKLVARRIGGLWYVVEDSLREHKEAADAYVPNPPNPHAASHSESVVTFDGKAYTAAAKAAKICGYHPDYVTQLARSEKIASRHVSNRWYVDLEALKAHKKEKDALLAEVQSIAVGIRPNPDAQNQVSPQAAEKIIEGRTFDELHFTYRPAEAGHLLPPISPKEPPFPGIASGLQETSTEESGKNIIPIRVVRGSIAQSPLHSANSSQNDIKRAGKTHKIVYTMIVPTFFVLAVAAAYYFRAFDAISFPSLNFAQTPTIDARIPTLSGIQNIFEDLFSRNIEFVRQK